MTELRRDPVIGRWVIVETKKPLKPGDYEKEEHEFKQEATCQFCPGREAYTPPEVDAIRPDGTQENSPDWLVRVVPNKFPALRIEGGIDKKGLGIYDMCNGIGAHEVLIETRDHHKSLADLTVKEIANVIQLYQNRSLSLAKDKRFKYIMIFKNHGESAGASVEHPHSQIIALPMVPRFVTQELEGAHTHFEYRGRCLYCDMIEQEIRDKDRIVVENEMFLSFCPYVPRYPFETWIIPKEHKADFCSLSEEERLSLSGLLKDILSRMKETLSDPSYNFYLRAAPVNYENAESFHWHIDIIPQLTREAGFEWGTGIYMVNTDPAVAAGYLRDGGKKR